MHYLLQWQDTVRTQELSHVLRFNVVSSILCLNETNVWVIGTAFAFWKESWHTDLQTDVGAKGGVALMSVMDSHSCFLSF